MNSDDEHERRWRIVIGMIGRQVPIKHVSRQITRCPEIAVIHCNDLALFQLGQRALDKALGKAGREARRFYPSSAGASGSLGKEWTF